MKISTIQVTLVPERDGETHSPILIARTTNKEWHAELTDGTKRGLFPSEIKLIALIQNEVIDVWGQSK